MQRTFSPGLGRRPAATQLDPRIECCLRERSELLQMTASGSLGRHLIVKSSSGSLSDTESRHPTEE